MKKTGEEVLTIEKESVIKTQQQEIVDALSELFVNESDRKEFLKFCKRVDATIRAWYHHQFSTLMRQYMFFDPSRVEPPKASPERLAKMEDEFIDVLFRMLEKSNYKLLSQNEFDIATTGKYLLNLPITVNKKQLDSELLGEYFQRHPPPAGEVLPEFSSYFVVFRRGVGIHQTKDLFINEKIDVLISRFFNGLLSLIGLKKKSRESAVEAVALALKKSGSIGKGKEESGREEDREELLKKERGGGSNSLQLKRIRLESLPLTASNFLSKTMIQEPTFDRIIVLYRPAGKKTVIMKQFHDIPMADMEIVFPAKKSPGLTPMDWITMLSTAAGGLAALVGTIELQAVSFTVITAICTAVLGYISKIYFTFTANQARYHSLISDAVYSKQLDSGRGTLLHICHEVVQQEVKEVIIAYYILMTQGKASKQELDERCEDLLADDFGEILDFEVSDACRKLEQLGIISKEPVTEAYVPVTLKRANEIIGITTDEVLTKVTGGD